MALPNHNHLIKTKSFELQVVRRMNMLLYRNSEYDMEEVLPGYSALIKKEY